MIMGYGDFTRARAAARPTAFAAGGASETQPRLPALPEGEMSRRVTRRGRESSLTPEFYRIRRIGAATFFVNVQLPMGQPRGSPQPLQVPSDHPFGLLVGPSLGLSRAMQAR